jgi:hypothetical protein
MVIKMKRNPLAIGVTALVLSVVLVGNSQASDSKYRLGLQGTHFLGGLSGVMEISDPWALQGVLDFGVNAFAFRVLNRFHQEQYWNAYGEGTLGIWNTSGHRTWGRWDNYDHRDRDSDFGLGLGIGVEYDWRGLDASLPPIGWNIELGANVIPDFDLDIGLGVHWKF